MASQSEIAEALTSLHPPTNTVLLEKWKQEVKDGDLQTLIACWASYVTGETQSNLAFYDEHQKVVEKLNQGFYDGK